MSSADEILGWKEAELLQALGEGADVLDGAAVELARRLVRAGLAREVKAKRPGAVVYAAAPTAKGRRMVREYFRRALGIEQHEGGR